MDDEVGQLLKADFIRETLYPDWLVNPLPVKKNGKWRFCIDFTDLNRPAPKTASRCPT